MTKATIDVSKITKAAKSAFKDACFIAHRNIIQVISEPGAFPSHPSSDIVDKGLLRASQQPPVFSQGDTVAIFANGVSYGIYVALGYTTRSGIEVEGRNWMMLGLRRTDLTATTQKLLDAQL